MSDIGTRHRLLSTSFMPDAQPSSPDGPGQNLRLSSFRIFRSKSSEKKDDSSDSGQTITQDPGEKADKALEKIDQLEQQQNLTIINLQRLVAEHERSAAIKKKINLILYP